MSWDSYIDATIGHGKDGSGNAHVDKVCIIGMDGSGWTSDGHGNSFKLLQQEKENIAKCFKSKDFSTFMSSGVHAEGTKYQFLREQDEGKLVLAKKKDCGAVSMQCSKTAVVIGHCPEGGQQGNTNKAVGTIAEYLESIGY